MSTDEPGYELVLPLIACKSNGGYYDDEAFVAGCAIGQLEEEMRHGHPADRWVYPRLVPQVDLIAMDHGYTITSELWDEHPLEWAYVTFTKAEAA